MSKHFNDIGKDSKDLINDDFPSEGTVKLITQSKTHEGVTAKATLRRYVKGGTVEHVDALIEPKFEWKEKNIELNGKLSTSNEFSANVIVKDLVKGSKIEFTGTSDEKSTTSKIVVSHKTDPAAAKVTINVPLDFSKKTPPIINGDVVIQYPDNLFLGGNVFLNLNEKMGVKCHGAIGYTHNQWQITGKGSYTPPSSQKDDSLILLGVSFYHKLTDRVKWALDFETDKKKGPVGTIAGEYKVDNFTTLKGKYNIKIPREPSKAESRVALSAKQRLSPHLSVILGADLNVRNILGRDTSDALHSFGVEFKLHDHE